MEVDLNQVINFQVTKKNFGWRIALCQHPMYLLIDEDRGDPVVGERVPPWGAPDAAEYVKRVFRNLGSLEKFSDLRLNYQFSGAEMLAMARDFPEVVKKMKEMYDKGSLDFLDGSFSQPHLQAVGSESNWRQFEEGLEVFEKLFNKKVKVYARQETGLHQQLPQILKKFDYTFMMLPPFPWAFEVIDGKMEMVGFFRGPDTIAGDEFLEAQALDGSSLPVYSKVIDAQENIQSEFVQEEIAKDMYAGPPIWTFFPDLIEVDEKIHDDFKKLYDFALLEKALMDRFPKVPPRAKVRIYTYWSYMEGVWAEELLRKNKLAEESTVLAESVYCMGKLANLSLDKKENFKKMWQVILKYQHHDVYWIEVTDLRRKAIDFLDDVINKGQKIMDEVAEEVTEKDESSICIFNSLPEKRRCLVEIPDNHMEINDKAFQKFGNKSIGFLDLPPGGFKSFNVSKGKCSVSEETSLPQNISTSNYKIEFSESGLIKQITTNKNQALLKTDEYLGGEMRALISDKWVNNHSAECCFYKGNVACVLERKTALSNIPITEKYFFFNNEPFIKAEIEFDFNGNEVGNFWLDETKINIYYPTKDSNIYYDIPFGYVQGRERRPLFAINWLYCGGLVYVNRGTVKHWVRDGVIANLIAWGGRKFSNRMHFGWARLHQYDIGLYGKQKIEYFLIPFGEFNGNKIAKKVNALTFPVFISKGKGENSFYEIKEDELFVTSIYEKENKVWARGYKLPSSKKSRFKDWEIFNCPIDELK